MDLGNIVYIVAVLAYFIYQATRKKKDLEQQEQEGAEPEAPQKGMTFEELMKEIRQAQSPKAPEQQPQVRPKSPMQHPSATIPRDRPVSRKPVVVEADDAEARYYEGTYAASKSNPYEAYRNTHSIPSEPLVKFDYTGLNPKKVNPYAELLKNPKTLKQAIVVSEILKPKYF